MPPLAYPCASAPEEPEGHYTRLCPGVWPPFRPDHLRELAQRMRDSPAKRIARSSLRTGVVTMPSGFVYLGQFIDHDITRDNRLLHEAAPEVEQICNYRTPRLDLDLLYGKDPATVSCLYEADGLRLKLGRTMGMRGRDGRYLDESAEDLPREADGTALVIDPRSEEHLIIAQMHVLFARFHNRVLELLSDRPALSAGPAGSGLFAQARRFVTWHYQWIVEHEFLPFVVRSSVLEEIREGVFRLFPRPYDPGDNPMALPVEFAVAAFRFGHSAVQTHYFLNDHRRDLDTDEIIAMTRRGGNLRSRLPADHVVDWRRFFARRGQANFARRIDTFIAECLYDLPARRRETSGSNPGHRALPELTLLRGSLMGLPSGQEFAGHFHLRQTVPAHQMATRPEDEAFFRASGFNERTPLWYYLLREAAVEPNSDSGFGPNAPLQKLGSIGSRIVGETLCQVLNADPESIKNAGAGWRPPPFIYGESRSARRLASMTDLVEFAQGGMD